MQPIRVVICGVGAMGQLAAQLMAERGLLITGAVGHVSNVGRDLGELLGFDRKFGVVIDADPNQVLDKARADIAVIAVGESMRQTYSLMRCCLEHGVNVLSLAEEALYPWSVEPDMAAELDALAKRHQVTLSAGGIQDVFWVNMVAVLSAASQSIEAIEGLGIDNIDDYGPAISRYHALGEPAEAFRRIPKEPSNANVLTISLEALAAELGLRVTSWEQEREPLLATCPTFSRALGRVIQTGQIVGEVSTGRVSTSEGVRLSASFISKVFGADDVETSRWVIRGVPELHLENPLLPGRTATCTAIINRIPDIIACKPGFVTVERLPKPKFRGFTN